MNNIVAKTTRRSAKLLPAMVASHFEEAHKNSSLAHLSQEEFYANNLYFITFAIGREHVLGWRTKPEIVFKPVNEWYWALSKGAYRNNLNRKRHLQPRMYAFLDVEGTKRSKKIGDVAGLNPITDLRRERNGGFELLRAEAPHVHGIMFVNPDGDDEFRKRLHISRLHCHRDIADIDIQRFDPKHTLVNTVGYCMKGYMQLPSSYVFANDCYQVYPG